jgi:sirohydrochlorin cobaltochelatase
MEQDQFLRWYQPLSAGNDAARVALLIAAHGERRAGADNEGVWRIAQDIAARNLVSQVGVGFINGAPNIREALAGLTAPRVVVYPLFASSGYFTRDRLVQLLDEANGEGRNVDVLPPLGLDRGLPDLVLARAIEVARERGIAPEASTVVLLAHGSRRNPASREATEQVAREIEIRGVFRAIRIALLEERPSLGEVAASVEGPAIVVGLFSGEGMHGARDAPKLIAELDRSDIAYAGVIGSIAGIRNLVARSVEKALRTPLP